MLFAHAGHALEEMVPANPLSAVVGLACAHTDAHTSLLDCAPPPAPPSCPAPSYLHKKDIVHGNLTLGTIFIQHDGLVKIGAGGTGRVY